MPRYRPGKSAAQAEAEHDLSSAVKLASNEHPFPPDPRLVEAVAASAAGSNRYADHLATELRHALAAHVGVDVERVTVGNGSVGLLQQLCLAYVDPGDDVVYPWRSFEVYPVFTQLMGGRSVQVPLAHDLGHDLDAVAAAVTPDTKLVFLATPNNPTGVATSVDDLATMLSKVPDDVIVCIDEAYREFVDPRFGDPVTELVPRFPNVVVTRTFSKAFALAGVRIGYGIGHPSVVAMLDAVQMPFAVSAPAQAVGLAALDHRDSLLATIPAWIAERDRVVAELRGAGWSIPDVQGNFVWLPTGDASAEVALALEQRGVVVRPFPGEGLRVSTGSHEENDRFLDALRAIAADTV